MLKENEKVQNWLPKTTSPSLKPVLCSRAEFFSNSGWCYYHLRPMLLLPQHILGRLHQFFHRPSCSSGYHVVNVHTMLYVEPKGVLVLTLVARGRACAGARKRSIIARTFSLKLPSGKIYSKIMLSPGIYFSLSSASATSSFSTKNIERVDFPGWIILTLTDSVTHLSQVTELEVIKLKNSLYRLRNRPSPCKNFDPAVGRFERKSV